jgi:hypothetical protein
VILRLIILYFVTQWRRTAPVKKQREPNNQLVLVRGSDWLAPWTPIVITEIGVQAANSLDAPDGVIVPYTIGNAVLTHGIHDFSGYQVPTPDGHWLGRNDATEQWSWHVVQPTHVLARIFQHYIIKEDLNMGYAIGTKDVSDVRTYTGTMSSFGGSGPLVGQPFKQDGTSIAPATAQDEVIHGVIRAISSVVESGVTTYEVTCQIAEGDVPASTSTGGSEPSGTPLFVADYNVSSLSGIDGCYSTTEPLTGFSHALVCTVDSSALHYCGTNRPVSI